MLGTNICVQRRFITGKFGEITCKCSKRFSQIDDDENVAETIIVEIHADNEDSFVDKNVTLTMYKIGETPGGE